MKISVITCDGDCLEYEGIGAIVDEGGGFFFHKTEGVPAVVAFEHHEVVSMEVMRNDV